MRNTLQLTYNHTRLMISTSSIHSFKILRFNFLCVYVQINTMGGCIKHVDLFQPSPVLTKLDQQHHHIDTYTHLLISIKLHLLIQSERRPTIKSYRFNRWMNVRKYIRFHLNVLVSRKNTIMPVPFHSSRSTNLLFW